MSITTIEELKIALNELLTDYNISKEGICEYTNCLNLPTERAPNGEYDFSWKIDADETYFYFFIHWGWEDEQGDYGEDRIMLAKSKSPQKILDVIKSIKACE